jgi:hypothetical protein
MRLWPVALLFVACTSNDRVSAPVADAGGADAAGPRETACAGWSAGWCSALSRCAPDVAHQSFESQDACTQRMTTSCVRTFFAADTGITPDTAGACFGAFQLTDCNWVVRAAVEGTLPDACRQGIVANGQSCGGDLQCASGRCVATGTGCGTCTAPVAAGQSCAKPSDCALSQYCDAVCKARGELGDACTGTSQCHAELACVSGKCAARHGVGDSCADDDTNPCAHAPQPLACDVATLRCVDVRYAMTGDACDPHGNVECDYSATCTGVGSQATCARTPDDGQPCTSACRAPARCWKGTCDIVDLTVCGALPP